MRITNKIMQRNNLANINTNKIYQDKLSTQMSTQKKIAKASDDPVVAIRALRLRSNVTEVTQYYSKNIPDAQSWLEITEDALKNQSAVMTNMIEQCTKGANGDLSTADRGIILEQLQALSDEVYSTANADYAGRYVFTGYRTDTPLSFISSQEKTYEIKEQLNNSAISTVTRVESGDLKDWTATNYQSLSGVNEQAVNQLDVFRIQLAYDECSQNTEPLIRYRDASGTIQDLESTMMHSFEEDPTPYMQANMDPDAVIYVPETGEILLGANRYQELMSIKDDISTNKDEGQIQVIYRKDSWDKGDLRPEHYFYCKSDPGTAEEIEYNNSLKAGKDELYNRYVKERDEAQARVDETMSKYPDVPYLTAEDANTVDQNVDTINSLRERDRQLQVRREDLERQKSIPGIMPQRVLEINEEIDEIDTERNQIAEEITSLSNTNDEILAKPLPDEYEQLAVPNVYLNFLDIEIREKQKVVDDLEDEKNGLINERTALESESYSLSNEQERLELQKEIIGLTPEELAEEQTNLANAEAAMIEESTDLDEERDSLQEELETPGVPNSRKNAIRARLEEIYYRKSQLNDARAENTKRKDAVDSRIADLDEIDSLQNERTDLTGEMLGLMSEREDSATTADRKAEINELLAEKSQRLTDINNRLNLLQGREEAIDNRLAAIQTRQGEIDDRIAEINDSVAAIDRRLDVLNPELQALIQKRQDLGAFNADWATIKHLTDEITFMDGDYENQAIEYDVGFNQTIRVNSTAGECFQHGIGRAVDDLVTSLQEVTELEDMKNRIKEALAAAPEGSTDAATLKNQLQAAEKALDLAKDKNQKLFEYGITTFQKYLDDVSLSITNCGNRSRKLELIENRMQNQKTTFETLRSENEDADIAETAIQLTSAQLTYEAALMATGKVSQNSLLQYI